MPTNLSQMSLVEAQRLLGENFMGEDGAKRLAQLLSTFVNNPNIPITTNMPMTFRTANGVVPLAFNNLSRGDLPSTVFNFNDTNGNPLGSVTWDRINGLSSLQPNGSAVPRGGGRSSTGGGGFPGTVISGSGNTYQVQITKSTGTETVTVTQQQIAPGATIAAGTGCTVVQVGTAYFMNVAVYY